MTELQILRNALFDEIARVKRGTANAEDTKNIISASNAIVQTYNTELKAVELMIKVQESGADLKGVEVKVFEDDIEMLPQRVVHPPGGFNIRPGERADIDHQQVKRLRIRRQLVRERCLALLLGGIETVQPVGEVGRGRRFGLRRNIAAGRAGRGASGGVGPDVGRRGGGGSGGLTGRPNGKGRQQRTDRLPDDHRGDKHGNAQPLADKQP